MYANLPFMHSITLQWRSPTPSPLQVCVPSVVSTELLIICCLWKKHGVALDNKFIYKVIENNILSKIEIKTGIRNQGNLEILDGLIEGDKVIAEGLTKVRPGMKVKPIIKSQ